MEGGVKPAGRIMRKNADESIQQLTSSLGEFGGSEIARIVGKGSPADLLEFISAKFNKILTALRDEEAKRNRLENDNYELRRKLNYASLRNQFKGGLGGAGGSQNELSSFQLEQIQHLHSELEQKDARISELEGAFEELQAQL